MSRTNHRKPVYAQPRQPRKVLSKHDAIRVSLTDWEPAKDRKPKKVVSSGERNLIRRFVKRYMTFEREILCPVCPSAWHEIIPAAIDEHGIEHDGPVIECPEANRLMWTEDIAMGWIKRLGMRNPGDEDVLDAMHDNLHYSHGADYDPFAAA